MHQPATRRQKKNTPLINLSNAELAELERANRKAKTTTAAMDLPHGLVQDEEGAFRNAAGQICDAAGQPIAAAANLLPDAARNRGVRQPPAEAERTLGEYNRPDQFYANRAAIRIPTFQRNDFELKPAYFTLVGQHPFTGLSHEHPMDHIEKFEDLVTSMKYNGVPQEYLFCKLFPYSLGGEAAYWLKQLPPGSLATWNETKNAFLNNFYDDARSEELRNKISQFSQGPTEAFKAAWVRFRSYQRDCPHHGFSQVQLLGIFYRGVDWRYQMALDSASNGNFNTRVPTDAVKLIENLVSSNSTKNADLERKRLASVADSSQIAEVQAKLDSMHNLLVGKTKKAVHFAEEVEEIKDEAEDVNYIGGSGFQGQRFSYNNNRSFNNNQQGGYKSGSNQSGFGVTQFAQKPLQSSDFTRQYGNSSYQPHSPRSTESKTEILLEQILQGQQKMTGEFNGKLDNLYIDLNGKIEALNLSQKKLETQIAQTASAVRRQEGFLPGKTEDPRAHINAISLRSGKVVESGVK